MKKLLLYLFLFFSFCYWAVSCGCRTTKNIERTKSETTSVTQTEKKYTTETTIVENAPDSIIVPGSSLNAVFDWNTADSSEVVTEGEGIVITQRKDPKTGKVSTRAKVKPKVIPINKDKVTVTRSNGEEKKTESVQAVVQTKTRHVDKNGIPWYSLVVGGVILLAVIALWLIKRSKIV